MWLPGGSVTAWLRWDSERLPLWCHRRTNGSIIRFPTSGEKGQARANCTFFMLALRSAADRQAGSAVTDPRTGTMDELPTLVGRGS